MVGKADSIPEVLQPVLAVRTAVPTDPLDFKFAGFCDDAGPSCEFLVAESVTHWFLLPVGLGSGQLIVRIRGLGSSGCLDGC